MIRFADALAAMERLPLVRPAALLDQAPLLILAPHPDDESLGCGGLIAAAVDEGAPPMVMIMTDGAGSHPNSRAYPAPRLRRLRQQEARDAIAALGLPPDRIGFLNLPDTESPVAGPAFDAAVTAIASLAIRTGARTILASWQFDPHCDHESTHLIAAEAAAQAGVRHLAYPVWGLTLPPDTVLPTVPTGRRIDIAAQLPRKRQAIAAHRSQHAGLIVDDPEGFALPSHLLALFDRPFETILDVP